MAHFIAEMPHFIVKTAIPVQKTGKVSDWYQSDNYLGAIGHIVQAIGHFKR